MKKKSSNLTPKEMRDRGWDNRTAEQRAAHVRAMGVACNAKMTDEQKRARALKGVAARAAKRLAAESVSKKQRKNRD